MAEEEEPIIVLFNLTANTSVFEANYTDVPSRFPRMGKPLEMLMGQSIHKHYLKVICALGLPGNLAAIFTIATVKPLSAATFLVALLAASDTMALVVKLIFNQLFLTMDRLNVHYCRSTYLVNVCSSYANWVLVLIALERLVAVVWPMIRNRCLSKLRVYCLCLTIALLILSIHAPLIIGSVVIRRFRCGVKPEVKYYAHGPWLLLHNCVYALLPIVLLMGITIALCHALSKARRRREHLLGTTTGNVATHASREMRRSERAITMMMLAASILFVLMVLPQCLYFFLFQHIEVFPHLRHTPKDYLIRQVTTVLADSTHALNFYLYFVSVRRFRQRVLANLRCQGRCCPRSERRNQSMWSSFSRSTARENCNGSGIHDLPNKRRNGPRVGASSITTSSTTCMEQTSLELECLRAQDRPGEQQEDSPSSPEDLAGSVDFSP